MLLFGNSLWYVHSDGSIKTGDNQVDISAIAAVSIVIIISNGCFMSKRRSSEVSLG